MSGKRTVICMAGMGRSGTSLMASYFQHCGVPMGDKFLEAGQWNRKGFFEDKEFLGFHKNLLRINNSNLYVPRGRKTCFVPDVERDRAGAMLRKRSEEHDVWGWKDPRSSLFMDMWSELDKNIKFVIMFRNPYEVVESIFRTMFKRELYFMPWLAPEGWLHYNRELIKFHEANPGRSVFVAVDGFETNPAESAARLDEWLGIGLDRDFTDVYDPADRRTGTKSARPFPINLWMPLVHRFYQEKFSQIFNQLNSIALIASGIENL